MRLGIGLAIALTLCGCIPTTDPHRDKALASKAIDAVHRQIEAGRFAALYAAINPADKVTLSATQFDAMAGAVRNLGPFRTSQVTRWYASDVMSGTFVHLLVASTHPGGTATEYFVFTVDGDRTILDIYEVRVKATAPPLAADAAFDRTGGRA